ncbi:DUF3040 domain-containing protein [Pseudonocardia sp. CA-142604]|uniref:DUF3040 domain-containing protein n=1 Tax=Pseudonocardia sp. CA-142604 TaxID=3240024 RepID=UPI003D8C7321
MMNREEERRLSEIERQLCLEDPQLAEQLAHLSSPRRRWRRPVAIAMAFLCLLCVLTGIAAGSGALVLFGLAILSVAVWLFLCTRRSAA